MVSSSKASNPFSLQWSNQNEEIMEEKQFFLSSVIIMNKKNMVVDMKYLFSFFYIIRFRFEYSQMVTINDGDGQDLPCLPECM